MNRLEFGFNVRGEGRWRFESEPEVRMVLRRLFKLADHQGAKITLPNTPAMAEDIEWILMRYPHQITPEHRSILVATAEIAKDRRAYVQASLTDHHDQPAIIATPLREYQAAAAAIAIRNKGLLIADDLGLGKTASAIGVIAHAEARQALVVCPTHLGLQWREQLKKFTPSLTTYIVKTTNPAKERIPPCDVIVISYSKIAGWRDHVRPRCVVFDECHALRHSNTSKWSAAKQIADEADIKVGLSATPIYNYGDEIWSVMECITPEALGSQSEFCREWTTWNGRHHIVNDPVALGGYLRQQGIMIRRTRQDVARELPSVNRIVQPVPHDQTAIKRVMGEATKLANRVLTAGFTEKGQASRELITMLRHATGIAKSLSVADLVDDIVQEGKQVLLGGWHRDVFDIWTRTFGKRGIEWAMYTGSESTPAKQQQKEKFVSRDAQVMIISLRSGEGLDGLQEICDTVVVGELDWSPKVVDQLVGRVHRDGQTRNVTVVYPVMEAGSDPIVSHVLGIKTVQSDGIVDLKDSALRTTDDEQSKGEALAHAILNQ